MWPDKSFLPCNPLRGNPLWALSRLSDYVHHECEGCKHYNCLEVCREIAGEAFMNEDKTFQWEIPLPGGSSILFEVNPSEQESVLMNDVEYDGHAASEELMNLLKSLCPLDEHGGGNINLNGIV
mmetsp:Transcript_3905/g.11686  ORF Transcript_3905/g.11686 Transcript_3905/m.11686 type:complete len:124 (-) Transcript_3905:214-585(-)